MDHSQTNNGDTDATDHITGEQDLLTLGHDKYNGKDQIQAANGSGLSISHVGHSLIHTPSRNLHLKNILHTPKVTKNLLSVHRFTNDNNVFFEFHHNHFHWSGRRGERSTRFDHAVVSADIQD